MTTVNKTIGTPVESASAPATQEAILEAARDVLAEGGVGALSMRSLADRVGLSATAIYHHFDGKDALIAKVVRLGYQRFGEYIESAVAEHPVGSIDRIMAMGEAYVRFAFENKEYFRVLYSIQERIPRDLEDLPGGGGYHLLRQYLVDAIESGEIRHSNPDLVAHFLWTCVHGTVTLALACNMDCVGCTAGPGAAGANEMFQSLKQFLLNGLRGAEAEEA